MSNHKKLTRADILRAASGFSWLRKMPKWTVVVEGRELPARPLVLEAAGVPPNDPTNSHQAVAILEGLGFETRYAGNSGRSEGEHGTESPTDTGSLLDAFAEIRKSVPESEWERIPSDFSKNVDHYLYGAEKDEE